MRKCQKCQGKFFGIPSDNNDKPFSSDRLYVFEDGVYTPDSGYVCSECVPFIGMPINRKTSTSFLRRLKRVLEN